MALWNSAPECREITRILHDCADAGIPQIAMLQQGITRLISMMSPEAGAFLPLGQVCSQVLQVLALQPGAGNCP
jgi:hypothetical protein